MGKSAQKLIRLAINNEELTEEQIGDARHKSLRASVAQLKESLTGIISPLQHEF